MSIVIHINDNSEPINSDRPTTLGERMGSDSTKVHNSNCSTLKIPNQENIFRTTLKFSHCTSRNFGQINEIELENCEEQYKTDMKEFMNIYYEETKTNPKHCNLENYRSCQPLSKYLNDNKPPTEQKTLPHALGH